MAGRKLRIVWQEDEQTLYDLYQRQEDRQDRARMRALWLVRQGRPLNEVAATVGVHYQTLRGWLNWYREGGVNEVLRRRHGGHGGKQRRLTPEQERALSRRAAKGEFHTLWDAVDWVESEFGVKYSYWGMRWVFDRLDLRRESSGWIAPQASAVAAENSCSGLTAG